MPAFNPQAVNPREIQDCRGYPTHRELAPASINRRLKALKSLFRWARREKLVAEGPFDVLESVFLKEQKNTAPRWLARRKQLALLRAVREEGRARDMAIIGSTQIGGVNLPGPLQGAERGSDLEPGSSRNNANMYPNQLPGRCSAFLSPTNLR